ncbi:transglycosylase SLT domain-containing protein [Rhizobium sullae]|uniref:transglycosylase SLT domain-containing protein n=1 Tax=Rhizobium sullae TaxID=50338 RepID=UPI000424518C|nr:transglycosylase SLT domain-containing protein [Rhizobium sullae]
MENRFFAVLRMLCGLVGVAFIPGAATGQETAMSLGKYTGDFGAMEKRRLGIKDISSSADSNIQAGNKYLRHLIDTYIADPQLTPREQLLFAFAAYNAGPGNLRKFRARQGKWGSTRTAGSEMSKTARLPSSDAKPSSTSATSMNTTSPTTC